MDDGATTYQSGYNINIQKWNSGTNTFESNTKATDERDLPNLTNPYTPLMIADDAIAYISESTKMVYDDWNGSAFGSILDAQSTGPTRWSVIKILS